MNLKATLNTYADKFSILKTDLKETPPQNRRNLKALALPSSVERKKFPNGDFRGRENKFSLYIFAGIFISLDGEEIYFFGKQRRASVCSVIDLR